MDLEELKKWIETDEGKAWLEGQKQPLLKKRDELLAAIQKGNANLAEQTQRASDAEKLLTEERAALRAHVVDGELDRLLDEQHVPAPIRPTVTALLNETYGIELVADGGKKKAVAKLIVEDGTEKVVSLKEMVTAWALTPEAKTVRLAPASMGGGASGGTGGGGGAAKVMALGEFNALPAQARLEFMRAGGKLSEG